MKETDLRPERGPIPEESLDHAYERRDLGIGILFVSLAGLGALVLLAAFAMTLFQDAAEGRARARDPQPSPMVEAEVVPPQPRLESRSGEILGELRALESVQLGDHAWLDQQGGIARLPIERAMEIVAERGGDLPWPAAPAADSGERP